MSMIWRSSANAAATARMNEARTAQSSIVSGISYSSERDVVILHVLGVLRRFRSATV
jgi:hypothetical protein